jgi:Zn finger protein HypA/HybF involved in hydrogenase expression
MSEQDRFTSRCPVCDSPLKLDEDGGYSCPACGWDETSALEDDVWIVPGGRDDAEIQD